MLAIFKVCIEKVPIVFMYLDCNLQINSDNFKKLWSNNGHKSFWWNFYILLYEYPIIFY